MVNCIKHVLDHLYRNWILSLVSWVRICICIYFWWCQVILFWLLGTNIKEKNRGSLNKMLVSEYHWFSSMWNQCFMVMWNRKITCLDMRHLVVQACKYHFHVVSMGLNSAKLRHPFFFFYVFLLNWILFESFDLVFSLFGFMFM